jgi:tetratricopeptide (TPR) repeat protein
MKNMEYRRFTIVNSDGEQLLISSCPNMKHEFTSIEIEVISKINELERKSGKTIGIPHYYSQPLHTALDTLIDSWDGLTEEQRKKELRGFIGRHDTVNFTAYKVVLKGKHDEVRNLIYYEERGWINYNSLGLSFYRGAMRARWQRTIKEHGPITLSTRNRLYTGGVFFNALNNSISNHILLQSVMNLLNRPVTEPSTSKSHITINFKASVQYGWSNVQQIEIEIKDVDPLFNELEALLLDRDYMTAIPLLEQYKDTFLEDLAFAYALDGRFDDSIACANEAIERDRSSVAQFTKGLALAGKGDFNSAHDAYLLAVHACTAEWHPVAKENIEKLIQDKHIQTDNLYDSILRLLDQPRPPMADNEKCYCRSGRKFKNCHGMT